VVSCAPQRFAVDHDLFSSRPPQVPGAGGVGGLEPGQVVQPGTGRRGERHRVHALQQVTDGRLVRHLMHTGEEVVADAEHVQDPSGRVGDPLADRGERRRSGQDGRDRRGQQRCQRMPYPTRITRVGHPREVGDELRNPDGQSITVGFGQVGQVAKDSGDQR
jgi:hypothetical protein